MTALGLQSFGLGGLCGDLDFGPHTLGAYMYGSKEVKAFRFSSYIGVPTLAVLVGIRAANSHDSRIEHSGLSSRVKVAALKQLHTKPLKH